jgi:hypothetical protein
LAGEELTGLLLEVDMAEVPGADAYKSGSQFRVIRREVNRLLRGSRLPRPSARLRNEIVNADARTRW